MPRRAPAELVRLQRGFLTLVTARGAKSFETSSALAEIDAADEPSARDQIAVYCRMYALRMEREVAREYPATRALLGDAAFGRAARAYVAAHPSRSYTLEDYAAALPEFLLARKAIRSDRTRARAAAIAAKERSVWRRSGGRVRVAASEAAFLRALLRGVELERSVAIATASGLAPSEIRRALEAWVGSGLFGAPLPPNLSRHLSLPCEPSPG